ncbi:ABC transporter permease [Helcococcus kunzii]|uniref:ABC transporter permease n=1 Tax=Helcococcus kunzii TaxID=40091 RepID=UPI0024ACBA00|nr:FtsX-like permease family protein [Helcococcus kunzii]
MKIILKEIKNNFRKNILYIIYLIVSILLCFMILASRKSIENKQLSEYNRYTGYEFTKPKLDYNYIQQLADDERVKDFILDFEFPYYLDFMTEEESLYANVMDVMALVKSSFTSQQEGVAPKIASDKYEIAIPQSVNLVKNTKIGDKVLINNISTEVVGYTDIAINDYFIGTGKLVKDLNLKLRNFTIYTVENMRETERKEFINEVEKNLETKAKIINPSDFIMSAEEKMSFMVWLVIFLSLLGLAFLFSHILNSRKKKYFIYRFNGMKKLHFYSMIFIEVILTFIICFAIALTTFFLMDKFVVKGIMGLLRYDLRIKSILLVFVLYMAMLMIATLLNTIKYSRKSLAQSYKEN